MLSPPSVSWQHVLEPLEHPWLFPRADRAKHTFEDKGGKLKECQGAIARGLRRRRWKRPEIVRVSGNKSARRTDAHLHKRTHHAPRTTHAHARTRARARARTHTHIHDGVDTNETLEGAPCALLLEFELRERLLDICFGSVAGARAGAACTERLIRQRVPPSEITHTHT